MDGVIGQSHIDEAVAVFAREALRPILDSIEVEILGGITALYYPESLYWSTGQNG